MYAVFLIINFIIFFINMYRIHVKIYNNIRLEIILNTKEPNKIKFSHVPLAVENFKFN